MGDRACEPPGLDAHSIADERALLFRLLVYDEKAGFADFDGSAVALGRKPSEEFDQVGEVLG